MKTAFLFPGQGAQFVLMGKDVAEQYPVAQEIFSRANQVLDTDIQDACFNGPEELLNTTRISQPAIFTTSVAILEVLRKHAADKFSAPDVTAGLSLGEYTALYAAGVISFEDGLKLVAKRGQAMQKAADNSDGGMVSIIGLDEEQVCQLCEQAAGDDILVPVNFNCPGQVAISGTTAACKRAEELAPSAGAIKAIRLQVAGAFHSDMMKPAADELKIAFAEAEITSPKDTAIIANFNADYYKSPADIVQGLLNQLVSPVLWQKCVERLIADDVETFYEIGPNRVLKGLMRRINRKANIINISKASDIEKLIAN